MYTREEWDALDRLALQIDRCEEQAIEPKGVVLPEAMGPAGLVKFLGLPIIRAAVTEPGVLV